jgi:hypothetical protein
MLCPFYISHTTKYFVLNTDDQQVFNCGVLQIITDVYENKLFYDYHNYGHLP